LGNQITSRPLASETHKPFKNGMGSICWDNAQREKRNLAPSSGSPGRKTGGAKRLTSGIFPTGEEKSSFLSGGGAPPSFLVPQYFGAPGGRNNFPPKREGDRGPMGRNTQKKAGVSLMGGAERGKFLRKGGW